MTSAARLLRASLGGRVRARILFLHIPKCGGESIHEAIRNSYGPRAALTGRGMVRLNPGASGRAAAFFDEPVEDFRRRLVVYHMANPTTRYLAGHLAIGERVMDGFGDGWSLVTVFREPVARFYSAYYYNRYKSSEHARIDVELDEFVESERAVRLGSDYVWRLTSEHDRDPGSAPALTQALSQLERFAVVGALERLDLFRRDYRAAFGAELRLGRRNANPVSGYRRDLHVSSHVQARIEQLCEPNTRVYQAVLDRLGDDGWVASGSSTGSAASPGRR